MKKNRVALVDLDPLVHLISHVQFKAGVRDASPALLHLKTFVNTMMANANSDKVIMFVQGIGHKNFRLKALPGYKGNRKEVEAITLFKPIIIEYLSKMENVTVLTELESDDALAIKAKFLREQGISYIVVENDKDLWCIPGTHYNPYKKGLTKDTQWFGVSPNLAELVKWSQILSGDGTDAGLDVTGVRGLAAGKPDMNNVWKPGKAMKILMPLTPAVYSGRVAKEYMDKYGVAEGLNRMAVTYSVIHILETPVDDIPESKTIEAIEAKPYNANTTVDFDVELDALF